MMGAHIYKKVELVGSSTVSSDDAVQNALARAAESIRNMDWFELQETRGHIVDGKVAHWQVVIKVGFRLEDASSSH
ncbi:MAG: dodecin [Sedimenticola sp.]